jgi:hypothetical protein
MKPTMCCLILFWSNFSSFIAYGGLDLMDVRVLCAILHNVSDDLLPVHDFQANMAPHQGKHLQIMWHNHQVAVGELHRDFLADCLMKIGDLQLNVLTFMITTLYPIFASDTLLKGNFFPFYSDGEGFLGVRIRR